MGPYIVLARPHQWLKNIFIFMPLFFGLEISNQLLLIKTTAVFFGFCFVSSAIYIFNDLFDREADRLHPAKRHRPLAAGTVSPKRALTLSITLLFFGLVLTAMPGREVLYVAMAYVLLNIFYTIRGKHLAVVDITLISLGFVLRLYAGSFATAVPLSEWILITTFLLSLFLALAKRRDDLLIYYSNGEKPRKVIDGYSIEFLNISMGVTSTLVLIAYLMYTVSPEVTSRVHSHRLYLTNLFVLLGVLRYLQITLVNEQSGSPTKVVLTDRFLQLLIAGWIVAFVWLLYL